MFLHDRSLRGLALDLNAHLTSGACGAGAEMQSNPIARTAPHTAMNT